MFMCWCLGSEMVGVKQKLAQAEDERKRRRGGGLKEGQASCLKDIESSLANRMLDLWGKGKLSAAAMQAMAEAAVKDGLRHQAVQEIASLGSSGVHTSNIHRDLLKLLHRKITQGALGGLKQSPTITLRVPAKDQKKIGDWPNRGRFPHLLTPLDDIFLGCQLSPVDGCMLWGEQGERILGSDQSR